jgi:chromosome segregation ATPase
VPALHDALSRTALASCAAPDDADLRKDADQALASLRDATDRIHQLHAATGLAERQEIECAEAIAAAAKEAKHRREKDRLQRQLDRFFAKYSREMDAQEEDQAKLVEEEAALEKALRVWKDANLRVDVRHERITNRQNRLDALIDEFLTIEEALAAVDNPPAPVMPPAQPRS